MKTRWKLMLTTSVLLLAAMPALALCGHSEVTVYTTSLTTGDCTVLSGNASWQYNALCSGWLGVRFAGGGSGELTMDTVADAAGDHFEISYTLEFSDPNASWRNELDVEVVDASTSEVLYHVQTLTGGGGSSWCDTHNVDLGHHSSWVNRTLRVDIRVYEYHSNAVFNVGSVGLLQSSV